ncbi:helix-turn-helix domain-containing protein [Paenibacillus sp. FSL K6-2524]|uniref:helix-turn-helix domain-containing protein n=1 Tax=Paenibacillus sp. FSL K6-2524 TaxID=2954516 RepID=UPI0030FB12EA
MAIVENLKALCKQHSISIPKLEDELGFGRGSIYNWDTNNPGIDKVLKVARRFGVSIEFLLQGYERRESFTSESLLKIAKENGSSIGRVLTVLDEAKLIILGEPIVGSEVTK